MSIICLALTFVANVRWPIQEFRVANCPLPFFQGQFLFSRCCASVKLLLFELLQSGPKNFSTLDWKAWVGSIISLFFFFLRRSYNSVNSNILKVSAVRVCCWLLLSRFSRVRLCATPQTAAHQASPSLGFSRQEHWSGLPFLSPIRVYLYSNTTVFFSKFSIISGIHINLLTLNILTKILSTFLY